MNVALNSELKLRAAEYVLEIADERDLVNLADRILIDGTHTPALGELTYLRNHGMSSVGPVFSQALAELGVPILNRRDAAELFLRAIAKGIIVDRKRSYDFVSRIEKLLYNDDVADLVNHFGDIYWEFDPREDVFAKGGRLVTDLQERQELLELKSVEVAQEWLATHGEHE